MRTIKLTIKKAKDVVEFTQRFNAATRGTQRIPAKYFDAVWEEGGSVRVGKAMYEITIDAPKPKKKPAKK